MKASLIIFLVLLCGCADFKPISLKNFESNLQDISGSSVDAGSGPLEICFSAPSLYDRPVAGVTVTVTGPITATRTTDSSGCVSGTFPYGEYTANAFIPGYLDVSRPLWHTPTRERINVEIIAPLKVCFVNSSDEPISGITVNLSGPANFNGTTDASGCIEEYYLPFGTYVARGSYPGYNDVTGDLVYQLNQRNYRYTVRRVTSTTPPPTEPTPPPTEPTPPPPPQLTEGNATVCVRYGGAPVVGASISGMPNATDSNGCTSVWYRFGTYQVRVTLSIYERYGTVNHYSDGSVTYLDY